MSKIAIYTRVSPKPKERADKSTSLEVQKKVLEDYCKSRGWTDITFYSDDLKSGRKANRPGLNKLMDAARKRKIDVVICYKFDRMFRSLKHIVELTTELKELDVQFISYKENVDLKTSIGRAMFNMIAVMGEFEADIIRERISDAIAAKQEKGMGWGRARELDRDKIFKLRDEGKSYDVIAREMDCSKSAIQKIINNEYKAG